MTTVPPDQTKSCHVPQASYIQNQDRENREFRTAPTALLAAVIVHLKVQCD
jgi:hypothetical protein